MPPDVDISALAGRFEAAVGPSAEARVVEGAKHALDGREEFAAEVISKFVSGFG